MVDLLLVRIGGRLCGLRLGDVAEVFRPLPIESLSRAPFGVLGIALVRGRPAPVLDFSPALQRAPTPPTRFVSMRAGERTLVLAVQQVAGITRFDESQFERTPPIVDAFAPEAVEALGRVDDEVLTLFSASKLLSEEAWEELPGEGVATHA